MHFKKGGIRMDINSTFDIINGPNKETIFDACKYAYAIVRVPIDFTIAIDYTQPSGDPKTTYIPMTIKEVQITTIEYEDTTGESLNLRGDCKASLYSITDGDCSSYRFNAHYNTKTRKGFISFLSH